MAHQLPTEIQDSCNGILYCLADWSNTVTAGLAWPLFLTGFLVVLFMGTMRFGTPRAFGFASIVGLIAATWLATMQLMVWWIASIFIILGAIGFAVLLLNER